MASNFKVSTAVRNAMTDAAVDRVDTGTGVGRIEIRVGLIPTNLADVSSGALLGTPLFGATAFGNSGAVVAGRADANPITPDIDAAASGDAGYFRVYQGAAADTAAEWQGTAGEAADTPDMEFNNKTIVDGGTITISSFMFTTPIQ